MRDRKYNTVVDVCGWNKLGDSCGGGWGWRIVVYALFFIFGLKLIGVIENFSIKVI